MLCHTYFGIFIIFSLWFVIKLKTLFKLANVLAPGEQTEQTFLVQLQSSKHVYQRKF